MPNSPFNSSRSYLIQVAEEWMKIKSNTEAELVVIDLDDTLLKTDLMYEQAVLLLKTRPLSFFLLPFVLTRGKPELKNWLSQQVLCPPENLPYRETILDFIQSEKTKGRRVVLASASNEIQVEVIAKHLGIFDDWFGSSRVNLRGTKKLEELVSRYPDTSFCYAGNCVSDHSIWEQSSRIIAVNPGRITRKWINSQAHKSNHVISDTKSLYRSILSTMRVHQWAKNTLIFLPLLASHSFGAFAPWLLSAWAFLSFSLMASSVYILNDLMDLESDRQHPKKKHRPFASGNLPLRHAFVLWPTLFFASLGLGAIISPEFLVIILGYWSLNVVYSLKLKQVMMFDVVALSALYSVRIIAGGSAANIVVSQWLLSFSIFFFFGLAMIKRITELQRTRNGMVHGRGYDHNDRMAVFGLGVAGSLLSIVVFMQYLSSADVDILYTHPDRLWVLNLILLYWVGRVWILATRNQIHDDPVLFALKDRITWGAAAVSALVLYWAS